MANKPYSDDSENPFADPSVASMTSNAARGIEDFNPFAEQNQPSEGPSTKSTIPAPVTAPIPQPTPTTQPAIIETRQEPPPYSVVEEQENLKKRQEDLERKAAELQRKEQELQRMQFTGYRENNFPPLPRWCKCKPCFYHDIQVDIPIEYQKTCRSLFLRWQAYSFIMCYNFLCAFALLVEGIDNGETFGLSILYLIVNVPLSFLCWYRPAYKALNWYDALGMMTEGKITTYCIVMFFNFVTALALMIENPSGDSSDGETFGISIAYLLINIPASFLCWYRPAYKALKNDSSFSYVIFFLIFFLHIGINIYYTLGVPKGGACGFINATAAIHQSTPVGAMMFICACFFLIGVILDIILLIKMHRIYRLAGASFEKAQGEFAKGVATNPHVQAAATEAAVQGVSGAMSNRK